MLCEAGNFLYIHADDEHNRLRAYVHNQMRVCIDISLSLSLSRSQRLYKVFPTNSKDNTVK